MSFPYMRLYTGDWQRDTLHLSCSEQGIYIKLVMHAWDQQGPVPLDERRLLGIVNARSTDEIEALRRVLAEFWTATPDGYYQKRVEHELEEARRYSEKQSEKGRLSAAARKRTSVQQALNRSSTAVEPVFNPPTPTPTPTPTLEPIPKTKTNTRASREPAAPALGVSDLVALGVERQHAADWIKARGKVPLTATALAGVQREAEKAGITLAGAIQQCAERGWRGFRADWYAKDAAKFDPFAGAL